MSRRLLAGLVLFLLAGCGPDDPVGPAPFADGPPYVQCVNYPLAYMAGRLAPDVDVRFEVPAGHDPAFWKPAGDKVRAFQGATLILANGADYAKWMKTASLPTARIVDTSAAFAKDLIDTGGGVTHSHGPDGDHTHGDLAFTTWLDFSQAIQQAEAVANALTKRKLADAPALDDLRVDLMQLHDEMMRVGHASAKQPLLASHPVYQYMARVYGLNIKSEHFEPGTVPSDEELEILRSLLKVFPAKLMLWEAEPGGATRAKLKALGIESVVFDPCANRPADGDFVSVMRANVERLDKALAR